MLDIHPIRPDEIESMLEIAHAAGWASVFNDDYATRRGRSDRYRMRVAAIDGMVAGFCEGSFDSDFAGRGAR